MWLKIFCYPVGKGWWVKPGGMACINLLVIDGQVGCAQHAPTFALSPHQIYALLAKANAHCIDRAIV